MIRAALLSALLLPVPAGAEDIDPAPLRAAFEACLPDPQAGCAGRAAMDCAEVEGPGGGGSMAQSLCLAMETALWDEALRDLLRTMRVAAVEEDALRRDGRLPGRSGHHHWRARGEPGHLGGGPRGGLRAARGREWERRPVALPARGGVRARGHGRAARLAPGRPGVAPVSGGMIRQRVRP